MHAIHERERTVNGVKFSTFSRDIVRGDCDVCVEAGTTGFRGYLPREKSSRAYVSLDIAEGDFYIHTLPDDKGRPVGVEIACCGDEQLYALASALMFASKAITDGIEGK